MHFKDYSNHVKESFNISYWPLLKYIYPQKGNLKRYPIHSRAYTQLSPQ